MSWISRVRKAIPFIAKKEGFGHIGEKVVQHNPRKYGKTKFGFDRFINGFLDLLTITFVFRFGKKPMHFFGAMGTLMFFLGGFFAFLIRLQLLTPHGEF